MLTPGIIFQTKFLSKLERGDGDDEWRMIKLIFFFLFFQEKTEYNPCHTKNDWNEFLSVRNEFVEVRSFATSLLGCVYVCMYLNREKIKNNQLCAYYVHFIGQ